MIGTGGGPALGMGGAPAACAAPIPITGTAATVTVNLGAAPIATVSPDLLGVHTAVYDSILTTDPTTPALLNAGGITSLRYPGGSYADVYHWESNSAHATPAAGQGSNVIFVADTANFGSFVSLLQSAGANAFITVNYGMNSTATGPAVPQQAAAWVAYANGAPGSTTPIGTDVNGINWQTVGYWAGLRASAPLAVDTVPPTNFLRINRPAPVGIKYWELGNELYGNGYYNGNAGSAGWEADLHAPYNGTNGTLRRGNPALAPAVYGMAVRAFAAAMKAVDPTIQVGGIVTWPDNQFTTPTSWNSSALSQACASMDFAVAHWYPGSTIVSLLPAPRTEIPAMYAGLRGVLTANCPAGKGGMPIAISEWGPNINVPNDITAQLTNRVNAGLPPTNTQIVGLFAAEAYATFMEQGVFAAHWAQMHIQGGGYLEATAANNWGYHGAVMAHHFAGAGDNILPLQTTSNALLYAHASRHSDGSIAVMLTNTNPAGSLAVTVNMTGGAAVPLACSGFRYGYTSAGANLDGPITTANIFSATTRTSFAVAVPAYSVVVVVFPPG
ncbi:MAG TPA: hypothetical protein VFH68_05240 [Polyangia bacterium]|nr:hypothetical protein [Polyangia bacterium]